MAGAGQGPVCQPPGGVPERGCTCQRQLGWGCGSRQALTEGAAVGAAQVSIPLPRLRVQHGQGHSPGPQGPGGACSSSSWQAERPGPALSMPPPDTAH